ncbi:hypothetical protein B296_00013099 [Ensete ventricosum]|uniref:Uncharacterized protein n=1 Tax=Ensete ventricosum TaxID=4639 RepID=A0A427B1R8_ENSVE|nr:hypothetical protein B296_00013099 [Ensete ventricosum]
MYAVQVMNFLRMLILKTLKERQESTLEDASLSDADPPDENGHHGPQLHLEACIKEATEDVGVIEEPVVDNLAGVPEERSTKDEEADGPQTSHDNAASEGTTVQHSTRELFLSGNSALPDGSSGCHESAANCSNAGHTNSRRKKTGQPNNQNHWKGSSKAKGKSTSRASLSAEKSRGTSIASRINSKVELVEAWR